MKYFAAFCLLVLIISGVVCISLYVIDTQQQLRERIVREGFEAGAADIPVEACPYGLDGRNSDAASAQWWRTGWIEGKKSAKRTGGSP